MTTVKKSDGVDYSTEQKIMALYELQQIDSKIDSINHIKGELPYEVQDLEDEVAGLDKRVKDYTSDIEEITRNVKGCKEKIEQFKINVAKYTEQQNNVRNNREYESIEKEIEYQNLEIEHCEKIIKEHNAESKAKKKQLEEAKTYLAERKIDLDNKREELATIDAETSADIEQLQERSASIAECIEERLLNAYTQIRGNMRNGLAVVQVKRDACSGCFNRIPPQRQLDIRMSKKIIICEYCGRILVSDLIGANDEQE